MVTVETAIALGSMMIVLAIVVGGIGALLTQIAVVDAAREAARVAATAGPQAGTDAGRAVLGGRGRAEVSVRVEQNRVVAHATSGAPGLPAWTGVELSSTSVAQREEGVAGG